MATKRHRATSAQLAIAHGYEIPVDLAHTICVKKCNEYFKYLGSPKARLEAWLDKQEDRRRLERGDVHNGGHR